MKTKPDFLKKAAELGIKDADKLSWIELRRAVFAGIKAANTSDAQTDDNASSDTPSVETTSTESTSDKETVEKTTQASADSENSSAPKKEVAKKAKKPAPTYFEDENGQKYGFTKRTPKKFRFNGAIKSQAEWLKDVDAMEMLVYGNSMYIERLN
jgi:N-acetylmuramoyl-L-alanine amidase CwlA